MGARMGSVDLLRDKGIDAIPTDEGVNRFLKIFTHDPGRCQTVVTARMGGLDTWNQSPPDQPKGWRFLASPIHFTPGVEAIFSTHLSLETDPYLRDHHFQGSYLFPTVFGLEAMAQAARYLSGHSELSRVQIRDVRLLRPITVDPETGADITIHAILAEAQNRRGNGGPRRYHQAGDRVQSDFFEATLVFGCEAVRRMKPLPVRTHPCPWFRRPTCIGPACFSRDLGSRASNGLGYPGDR
jgi:enediyne polyketide synthase